MGSAQQTNRKNPTAGARSVAAARGTRKDRSKIIIGVVVVVVIAAAVIVGVIYQQHQATTAAEQIIPADTVAGSSNYPVVVDKNDATVLVGKDSAKVSVDIYEDFLCPFCGQFETAQFNSIEKQLEAGTLKVRYHIIDLLNSHSNPPGYSLMAANTALAVATVAPEKFIDFHYSLYNKQPEEGGAGWTQDQLNNLASRLGVSGSDFLNLVNNKTYNNQIDANMNNAINNKALWTQTAEGTGFGTPTIVANGQVLNWSDPSWLDNLIKAAYPSK